MSYFHNRDENVLHLEYWATFAKLNYLKKHRDPFLMRILYRSLLSICVGNLPVTTSCAKRLKNTNYSYD